jgi:hypothetical protein
VPRSEAEASKLPLNLVSSEIDQQISEPGNSHVCELFENGSFPSDSFDDGLLHHRLFARFHN